MEAILKKNLYLTIATSTQEGSPWISNLYFTNDKDLNIYWYSPLESKHSKLIQVNPNVAINVFDSTAIGGDVYGLYIEAIVSEVTSVSEISKALALYGKKMLLTGFVQSNDEVKNFVKQVVDFQGKSPLRLYKAVPSKAWLLGESDTYNNKYVDGRIEITL